jgi:hypothetical protein
MVTAWTHRTSPSDMKSRMVSAAARLKGVRSPALRASLVEIALDCYEILCMNAWRGE